MTTVPHDKPLRAVLWCAVSSESQADESKDSLPSQEADGRALIEQNGWILTDLLIVPGHSRNYIDIHELAEAAAKENITAFYDLMRHWKERDFDVLIVRDADRFARTQSLHAYVVESTIGIDAAIYSLSDGWIDKNNYRMWIAMGGYKSASHIDWIRKAYAFGTPKRVSKGLPASQLPITHLVERDKAGKAIKTVVNEEFRRLFDDAATLLLEGIGWADIALMLYERFGHANPKNGKPYAGTTFRNIFYSPWTWGHAAHKYVRATGRKGAYKIKKYHGAWAFDADVPLPSEVQIWRDVCPPVYTGDFAEEIKAELRRRGTIIKGRAGHRNPNMFTGLLVCGSCACRLSYRKTDWISYRCFSADTEHRYQPRAACKLSKRTIGEKKIIAWFHERLGQMLTKQDPLLLQQVSVEIDYSARIAQMNAEIITLEGRIGGLLLQRADTPLGSQHILTNLIHASDQQLERLRTALKECENHAQAAIKRQQSTQIVFDEIRSITLESFWKLPPEKINRLLLMLLGDNRLVVLDGEIIGIAKQMNTHHTKRAIVADTIHLN